MTGKPFPVSVQLWSPRWAVWRSLVHLSPGAARPFLGWIVRNLGKAQLWRLSSSIRKFSISIGIKIVYLRTRLFLLLLQLLAVRILCSAHLKRALLHPGFGMKVGREGFAPSALQNVSVAQEQSFVFLNCGKFPYYIKNKYLLLFAPIKIFKKGY